MAYSVLKNKTLAMVLKLVVFTQSSRLYRDRMETLNKGKSLPFWCL